jgi:hypothetical protein
MRLLMNLVLYPNGHILRYLVTSFAVLTVCTRMGTTHPRTANDESAGVMFVTHDDRAEYIPGASFCDGSVRDAS